MRKPSPPALLLATAEACFTSATPIRTSGQGIALCSTRPAARSPMLHVVDGGVEARGHGAHLGQRVEDQPWIRPPLCNSCIRAPKKQKASAGPDCRRTRRGCCPADRRVRHESRLLAVAGHVLQTILRPGALARDMLRLTLQIRSGIRLGDVSGRA